MRGHPWVRFMSKVEQTDSCWLWMGCRSELGYGSFGDQGRNFGAHRWSYLHFVGPIPEGLQLDHLCRNPPCVNPAHLEPVTCAENVRRKNAAITHCPQGHEYTPENTWWWEGRGRKRCRTCRSAHNRNYYRQRIAERNELAKNRAALFAAPTPPNPENEG